MNAYWCEKCLDYCNRRKSTSTKDGIVTLADIVYHKDGTRERREWGKYEKTTERIISMSLV